MRMVIEAVFGANQIQDNQRIIRTLMVLASKILRQEIKGTSIRGITSLYRTESQFKEVFRLVLLN